MDSLLPYSKILPHYNKVNIIIISCGSYNPIHLQHLRNFEDIKNYINNKNSNIRSKEDRNNNKNEQLDNGDNQDINKDINNSTITNEYLKYNVIQGIISPVHSLYPYKNNLISSEHRINICNQAVSDSTWLTVTNYECIQDEWLRTADVLNTYKDVLTKRYKDYIIDVRYLCGADLLQSFLVPDLWSIIHMNIILGEIGVTVLSRPGLDLDELIDKNELLSKHKSNMIIVKDTDMATFSVSSTMIRNLTSQGKSVKYLTHDSVIEYIIKNNLYK